MGMGKEVIGTRLNKRVLLYFLSQHYMYVRPRVFYGGFFGGKTLAKINGRGFWETFILSNSYDGQIALHNRFMPCY